MSLELFNKTNKIKELPKYNYNGKFKLHPNATYPIKDYMEAFYKPFEKVGVVVRRNIVQVVDEVEPEVQKILNEKVGEAPTLPALQDEEPTPEPVKEEIPEEVPVEEVADEPVKEEPKEKVKKYTEDELKEMKMNEIKSLLEKAGVEVGKITYKKDEYIKALLEAQEG